MSDEVAAAAAAPNVDAAALSTAAARYATIAAAMKVLADEDKAGVLSISSTDAKTVAPRDLMSPINTDLMPHSGEVTILDLWDGSTSTTCRTCRTCCQSVFLPLFGTNKARSRDNEAHVEQDSCSTYLASTCARSFRTSGRFGEDSSWRNQTHAYVGRLGSFIPPVKQHKSFKSSR